MTDLPKDPQTEQLYALRSNHDGRLLPERYTQAEAEASMRLDPWLAVPGFGDVTLERAS